ncbi:MAG TPA: SpoIIE family protein phosphatase [Bryobacteraceae bacterium]|nr:SpoIIE family protein phosphatase [Bryobacteraceae bacterium]
MATPARKSTVRFHERAELLDYLLEVSTATSETLDLDRIMANVAASVKEVIPYDLFAILLYSERQRGLSIRYSIGHREEIIRSLVLPLGEGITGAAAATRQPILVTDVRNDPRYLTALDAVQSELAVPMLARGKLVGVIDLQSTRLNAYREQDRSLLQLIASRVAVSIDNARLYRRVDRQNRTLKTLSNLSQEFSSILDLDELLGKIAKTIHALAAFDAFSILLLDAGRKVLTHRFSERYDQRVVLNNIPLGKGLTGAAAESREIVRVNDTAVDPRYIASHPEIRSEIAVPLVVQDRTVGVMDLESERIGFFTEEHSRLLALLAPQIASSVENARLYEELAHREQRMEQDMKAARNMQSVLLLREAPEIEGLDIAIRQRAAREITGDVYDIFEHGSDNAVFTFGDVSGKGAAAALYGAMVSGLLRTLAHRRRSPAALLRLLNKVLRERIVEAQYVTLMVLVWERAKQRFVIANAGATSPIICRKGEILKPRVEGVPAGLLDNREYEELIFEVQRGDLIVLYSDGITDQPSHTEEEYGRGHLSRSLKKVCGKNPKVVADQILADLDEFAGGTPRFDDQTLIVLKVR